MGGAAGLAIKLGWDRLTCFEIVRETRMLMGTLVNLTVIGDDHAAARAALEACLGKMESLEAVLSRHLPESQLSQLNHTGLLRDAHPALVALVDEARRLSDLTEGAFDITVKPLVDLYQQNSAQGLGLPSPDQVSEALSLVGYGHMEIAVNGLAFGRPGMAITLDGIAKGYIVDAGVAVLRRRGFDNTLVEAGGDLVASGQKGEGDLWQVGVQWPRLGVGGTRTRFSVQDQAVATSGDYMQAFTPDLVHHHILDPRTGYSPTELASASVVSNSATLADGLATALMVMGAQDGLALVESLENTGAYLITKELEVLKSVGFNET
jgi:thiamine biosynthesis lipoprotein